MERGERCPNMNHGRTNATIRYCPSCGEIVSKNANAGCDATKHAARRKQRDIFCFDCGKKL